MRPVSEPIPRFHQELSAAIQAAGITPAEFARRIRRSSGYVYGLVHGRRFRPPKEVAALRQWAGVLGLSESRQRGFVLAGLVEHCPEEVRSELNRLRRAAGRGGGRSGVR